MKATIESTDKLVELRINGALVPARVWEGTTEAGVPFHCFITRVAVAESLPAEAHEQFERELLEQKPASQEIQAIPLWLII